MVRHRGDAHRVAQDRPGFRSRKERLVSLMGLDLDAQFGTSRGQVHAVLKMPDEHWPLYIIPVGYPAE